MTYPGDAEQSLAVVGGSDPFHDVRLGRHRRSQRVPDAPDVAAALHDEVELAIGAEAGAFNVAVRACRQAVGKNRKRALRGIVVEDEDAGAGYARYGILDHRPGRVRRIGDELKTLDGLDAGGEDIAAAAIHAEGLSLIIRRLADSRQIAVCQIPLQPTGLIGDDAAEAGCAVSDPPVPGHAAGCRRV